jgi:acetylornithine deacetylase/succinyl-diaminopimelate desuccinylase-like protein
MAEDVVGNSSPVDSELVRVIEGWVGETDPGAALLPTILPGFTDSRTFRDTFPGVQAYGFFPIRHMGLGEWMPLVHGADERIDVRDLGLATGFFGHVAEAVLG